MSHGNIDAKRDRSNSRCWFLCRLFHVSESKRSILRQEDEAGGTQNVSDLRNSHAEILWKAAGDEVVEQFLAERLARNMRDALPTASFISLIGTSIARNDANERAVFGEYVSVYDIQQAVIDKATVPIYYESRIAKLSLNEAELPKVDSEFEEITEGEEEDRMQKLKTKWAALEALVGNEKRIRQIAEDLVQHSEPS